MFTNKRFITTLLIALLAGSVAQAQSETPKVEWGAQFSTLRLSDFVTWDKGVGSRLTYNINRNLSLEGEINVFFSQSSISPIVLQSFFVGERKTQGLFGVKAGARSSRFGFFGKLRPGLINFSVGRCQGVLIGNKCFGALMPGAGCRDANGNVSACPKSLTGSAKFALDMGGVIEFYPSRRFALRVDVGDTLIRNSQPGRTSHNFQISTGFSLRF